MGLVHELVTRAGHNKIQKVFPSLCIGSLVNCNKLKESTVSLNCWHPHHLNHSHGSLNHQQLTICTEKKQELVNSLKINSKTYEGLICSFRFIVDGKQQ